MNESNSSPVGVFSPPEPRTYSTVESVYAWGCLLAGYLLCRLVPVTAAPLGGFLLILGLFAATLIVVHLKGLTCPVHAWCAAGSAVTVSAALLFCAEPFLTRLCFWYAIAAYAYFVYAATGNTTERGFSDRVLIDTFKAAVVMPFCARGHVFAALFSGKAANSGKVLVKVLLGLALALVPTVAVLSLLSYDRGFSELIAGLFDFELFDVFSHLVSIGFGMPIGMYIFGMLIADSDHEGGHILTEEQCADTAAKCRVISPLTVAAATVPLLIVYVLFFSSQWQYFIAGFTGELPDGFSYASFAREGFFQLCAVSVINLVMILAALLVTRRKDDRPSRLLHILTPLYSLSTLVLIATAIAKMVMYIDSYGLTPKRVYATWFMVMIAVVFVLIVVGQFVRRMKTVFVCTAVCVVMFAGLTLSNIGGIIADYNVSRYLNGDLKTVDVAALESLGDAAVPALCRLYDFCEQSGNTSKAPYYKVRQVLRDKADELKETDVWSFTVVQAKAEKALRNTDLLP